MTTAETTLATKQNEFQCEIKKRDVEINRVTDGLTTAFGMNYLSSFLIRLNFFLFFDMYLTHSYFLALSTDWCNGKKSKDLQLEIFFRAIQTLQRVGTFSWKRN